MQSSLCLQFTSRVVPSKPIATKAKALAEAAQRTSKVPDRPDDRVAHAFNGHEERGRRRSRSASPRSVGRVASRANVRINSGQVVDLTSSLNRTSTAMKSAGAATPIQSPIQHRPTFHT
ncbi:hypothetical protein DFH09DRAFT_1365529 [Mycena vulgaris]|nr:hypothetical protein DFH09DRAFT_1365529 [Mycena vulgaris]